MMSAASDELLEALFDLSRVLLTEADLRGDLERVVSVAQASVPGCDGASVTLVVEGRPMTAVATDRTVLEADLIQYRVREGPCLSAIATGETIRVGLISADERFVRFAAGAGQADVRSVLSLPVSVEGHAVAGLNLYSHAARGFDQTSETVGSVVAAQAAVAVAKSHALASSEREASLVQDDRLEVGRALTVLQECTAEQARVLLRRAPATDHETVTEVARRLAAEARAAPDRPGGAAAGHWPAMLDHGWASELLGAYALDACDEDETAALEAHIAECPDCAAEATRLKNVAGWIGVSEAATPPEAVRTRLLREAATDWPDSPSPPPP